MRLVDRLRAGLVDPSPSTRLPEWADTHQALIAGIADDLARDVPVIVVDDVADYTIGQGGRDQFDIGDFPNGAPPWRLSWFEYRTPPEVRSAYGVEAVGFLVDSAERDNGGWTLFCWPFALPIGEQKAVGPIAGMKVEVAADGSVERFQPEEVRGLEEEDQYRPLMLLVPVMMAISFAHCRNVSQEVIQPAPRLAARHRKRYGRPLTRYRVLRIDPMREVLRREGGSERVGLRKALHICRGHFKTFDERPLFGRLRGTYFWPEHVRGHADRGTVRKGYVVLTPESDGSLTAAGSVTSARDATRAASPEHIRKIEAFSIERALDLVRERWPDLEVHAAHHSNPGYDIRVGPSTQVSRYVEVKGTSAASPGFFISENERRFSVDNSDRYSLLVVAGIDLDTGAFTSYWHDGAIDDRFSLEPMQYRAKFPTTNTERPLPPA